MASTADNKISCKYCGSDCRFFGTNRGGSSRYRCRKCLRTFTVNPTPVFETEMYLNDHRGLLAIQLLVEGSSIRAAERITGLHRDAIIKLLLIAGERCERLMDQYIRNVPATDIQADECW